ncbi:MAG: hypothetical protein WKH64_05870 [Chloroflexia bacterium]
MIGFTRPSGATAGVAAAGCSSPVGRLAEKCLQVLEVYRLELFKLFLHDL